MPWDPGSESIWDAREVELSEDEREALDKETRMIGKRELENRFTHHAPDVAKTIQHERIRGGCLALAELVDQECPPGREQSTALTKIEEAMFWANAAIARST